MKSMVVKDGEEGSSYMRYEFNDDIRIGDTICVSFKTHKTRDNVLIKAVPSGHYMIGDYTKCQNCPFRGPCTCSCVDDECMFPCNSRHARGSGLISFIDLESMLEDL